MLYVPILYPYIDETKHSGIVVIKSSSNDLLLDLEFTPLHYLSITSLHLETFEYPINILSTLVYSFRNHLAVLPISDVSLNE